MDKNITELIKKITFCPNIIEHYNKKNNNCSEIIDSQNIQDKKHFQIPEPFSGEIDKAKILVISSNPSIDLTKTEIYPTYEWKDEDILNISSNFFTIFIVFFTIMGF